VTRALHLGSHAGHPGPMVEHLQGNEACKVDALKETEISMTSMGAEECLLLRFNECVKQHVAVPVHDGDARER
jgi:hypothetical protein